MNNFNKSKDRRSKRFGHCSRDSDNDDEMEVIESIPPNHTGLYGLRLSASDTILQSQSRRQKYTFRTELKNKEVQTDNIRDRSPLVRRGELERENNIPNAGEFNVELLEEPVLVQPVLVQPVMEEPVMVQPVQGESTPRPSETEFAPDKYTMFRFIRHFFSSNDNENLNKDNCKLF